MTSGAGATTFLLTEIVGSVGLWEADERRMATVTERLDGLVRILAARHRGSLVKPRGEGDSHFLVFADPVDAVACAAALLREVADEPLLAVRAASHVGPADERDGDWYGSTVNRCARLRAAAHARQAVVSAAIAEAVAGRLDPEVTLVSLGRHRLKDLDEPTEVFQVVAPGVVGEHPPLTSLPKEPGLPRPATTLVGREADVEAVVARLAPGRVVTVTGAAGVGKTRVALEAALRWAAENDRPVVRAPDRAPDAALVLVDDADPQVAAGAEWSVLATSRSPLGVRDEVIVRLAPLDLLETARLLEDRTGRPDLHELVSLLDGLPLAVELLARRAASLPADELDRRLRRDPLATLGGNRRADPARHASMERALAWSWDRLDALDRVALLHARPGDERWMRDGWHETDGPGVLVRAFLDQQR